MHTVTDSFSRVTPWRERSWYLATALRTDTSVSQASSIDG